MDRYSIRLFDADGGGPEDFSDPQLLGVMSMGLED
jgi:hypothetical protein